MATVTHEKIEKNQGCTRQAQAAQQSQFIALLEEFEDVNVFFKNPLTGNVKVEYNELYYYENSDRWILGQGFESDTMR